eukprot:3456846-Rhodomonas_salina.1
MSDGSRSVKAKVHAGSAAIAALTRGVWPQGVETAARAEKAGPLCWVPRPRPPHRRAAPPLRALSDTLALRGWSTAVVDSVTLRLSSLVSWT